MASGRVKSVNRREGDSGEVTGEFETTRIDTSDEVEAKDREKR